MPNARAELERREGYRYRCPVCRKRYDWRFTAALARKDESAHKDECRGEPGPPFVSIPIRFR